MKEKRLKALYEYSNHMNSIQRKELLTFLLAIINDRQIKEVVEYFNIKIK